jgi:hypothetical protein
MAITLADAALNTQNDIDFQVIEQFRKESWLLDNMLFDQAVNPAGGGATLTYGYTREKTERAAAFRAINAEYTAADAEREQVTTTLKPLGGSFEIDRILSALGPAQTNEVAFQLAQVVKSTRTKFADEFINGDTAVDANGFNGLDKILTGTSTEIIPGGASAYVDWSAATVDTEGEAHTAIDLLDQLVYALDGPASALLCNTQGFLRVKAIARRAGYYTRAENAFGQMVEFYGNVPIVDLGAKPASSNPIIPTETRDPDGAGGGGNITNLTDIYAVRLAEDAVHSVAVAGSPLLQTWLPDFSTAGAVKKGEVEMGPVSIVVKKTRAAAVLRNVKVA